MKEINNSGVECTHVLQVGRGLVGVCSLRKQKAGGHAVLPSLCMWTCDPQPVEQPQLVRQVGVIGPTLSFWMATNG